MAQFGSIELLRDEPSVPSQNGVRLGNTGDFRSAFRPRRLPISASVDLSGSDSRRRVGRWARKIRFSEGLPVTQSFLFQDRWRLSLIGEVFNLYNAANLNGYSGPDERGLW